MKSRVLDLLGVPAYHPQGFSRVGRQMRLFEGGGAEILYSDNPVAAPPRRVDTNFPVNHDWTRGPVTVGDIVYTPVFPTPSGGEGSTDSWTGGPEIYASVRGSTDPGVKYLRYDPSGGVVGEGTYGRGSRGFFGDFFSGLGELVTESPILQMAAIIPSPLQPFAAAANAVINKDPLAGIAALAGAGGFTDVANAAKVASAVEKGDLLGAVTPGLSLAGVSNVGGFSAKDISNAVRAADALRSGNPSALAGIASAYLPGLTMPGAGTTGSVEDIEDFFGPGKPGFMPTEYLDDAEVQRELRSLLGRYPATTPSDWFLGENIMSGVPEWDMAAVNSGLPIGNLEQDFYVAQTKQGPRIVDSAGNVGTFVNGEFVVDTGVTPDLSYLRSAVSPAPRPSAKPTPAPAPAVTAAKKQDDLGLLMALAGMMTPQQQAKDDYQLAQIGVASPYGIYGA